MAETEATAGKSNRNPARERSFEKPLWTITNRRNKQDETGFNEGRYRYARSHESRSASAGV